MGGIESHGLENVLAESVVVVGGNVRRVGAAGDERRLGLGGLCLLAALVVGLFLLHLLVAETGEGAGHLLDLVAVHVPGEILDKLLEEEAVVGLFGVAGKNGGHGGAHRLKLLLGLGVEEGQGGQVDRVGGVLRVDDDGGAGGRGLAAGVEADGAKQVLGVMQIRLLLGAAQALAALGLGLLLAALLVAFGTLPGALGLVIGDALDLALLLGRGLGISLGLGLGRLSLLLALYLGVFGGIPRVEDLV